MLIDAQIQILTAYRDNLPVEVRASADLGDTVVHDKWLPLAKPAHSASGAHLFDFRANDYRIAPPRAELWVVWNVNLARVCQTGPFESASDAAKKAVELSACQPVGENRYQYIPVRVHTDVSEV